jgi:hypothetical protein
LAAVVTGVLGPARGRRTFLTALAGSIILWAGLVIDFVAHRRNENWLTGHLLWYAGIVLTNGSVFAVLLTSIPAEPDDEPDIDPARQGTD